MLVGAAGITSLLRPEARLFYPRGIGGSEYSATRSRDDLVPVEGERPQSPKCSGWAIRVHRAEGFGCVFEHRHTVSVAECQDRIHIGTLAIKMHNYEGTRQLIPTGTLPERVDITKYLQAY